MTWLRRLLLAATGVLVLAVGPVAAHEVTASRFDAPLPLPLLYAGAAAVVAATALWLARTRPTPATAEDGTLVTVPARYEVWLGTLARAGFLGVALAVLAVGFLGRQTPTNPAVVVFWALWLKGLLVVSALVGSPWRVLSPWRTVHRALERVEGGRVRVLDYPDRLREWPAVIGFVAVVGVLETLTTVPRSPERTSVLLAGYATVMIAGGVVFGREWFDRADFFAVFYRLVGRVSPIRVEQGNGDSTIAVRRPWAACARPVASGALAVFIVAIVYTVSFDGFTSTPEYQTLRFTLHETAGALSGLVRYLLGLALFLAAFAGVAAATAAIASDSRRALVTAIPATLLPIAVGYELAHNATYVVRNLVLLVEAVTGHAPALLAWLPVPAYWGGQVVLLVGGHVVAVAAAHRALSARYSHARAVRAHAPLVVLMVAYTVISLWIISQPVVA